ncbi:Purine nucleoside phosphorylase [Zancudomyces culisetae]|uniref:Purine nucleoside phosphorylase n=1 Tax=Zancudomyces culisetae TaxID=1213189 RepID=A0A1R1PER6_ZANCU|nr:Purine nucleoside phosphorylase [Zancudomyces culisetae]|eukprot:OMH79419.1 Purine nucleoside phosphorylase [Zancudomyces culisetae]
MELNSIEIYQQAADYIRSKIPKEAVPSIAIICGSGLGGLADTIEGERVTIRYEEIPGFVKSTVEGHAGQLVFGALSGKRVVIMQGRFHSYEGFHQKHVVLPVRVFKLLGVETLIVTNAAGGLNQEFNVGDVMLLNDHVSLPGLVGVNPLVGRNIDEFGARFPAVNDVYSLELRKVAVRAWLDNPYLVNERKLVLREGTYAWIVGPCYETDAECRMLNKMECDVVGMSTVPEAVIAKQCGMKVLAFSLVTDIVKYGYPARALDIVRDERAGKEVAKVKVAETTHEEVLAAAAARALDLQILVKDIVANI